MKLVKRIFKFLLLVILGVVVLIAGVLTYGYVTSARQESRDLALLGPEAPVLQAGDARYRDLNKNGQLDPYEDSRAPLETRVNDLLAQMTLAEKAGLLFITMAAMNDDGSLSNTASPSNPFSLFLESNIGMLAGKKMNHFNTIQSLEPKAMLAWHNNMQKHAERTRLGIPVTLATDPRHGVRNAPGASIYTPYFSSWCSYPGFAAIGDTALMRTFGDIARQEYLALGFRLTLSPMADLATEPRWARMSGTFGEDAAMAAQLTKAYILGFQGDQISPTSVQCMVKHFSGGGPQEDGMDAHFPPGRQAYPGNNFNYHLIPFEQGAFPAGVAQVMPYYGIPVGQTSEDVGFGYNKEIITGLLRNKYHFDGIVCTDWALVSDLKMAGMIFKPASAHGVESLTPLQRVIKILDAGCDMFGGEALPELVVEAVQSGAVSEARLDESVRRVLREKFKLGLFDNPYVSEAGLSVLDNEQHRRQALQSQRRSLVLLKNEQDQLPLATGTKVYLHGFDPIIASQFKDAVTDLEAADVVILKINTPYDPSVAKYAMERIFHQGSLEFPEAEKAELLKIIQAKPTVTIISLERAAVIPEIAQHSRALIADFGSQDDVLLDLVFGVFQPEGKLPFELPSSMEAVRNQKEDVPHDSKDPLFPYGFGLSYTKKIQL
jgi:beta-glucosidase